MYILRCQLCQPGTEFNPPQGSDLTTQQTDLVKMQEHLMRDHGYTLLDLQQNQSSQLIGPGYYQYSIKGVPWLTAYKVPNLSTGKKS